MWWEVLGKVFVCRCVGLNCEVDYRLRTSHVQISRNLNKCLKIWFSCSSGMGAALSYRKCFQYRCVQCDNLSLLYSILHTLRKKLHDWTINMWSGWEYESVISSHSFLSTSYTRQYFPSCIFTLFCISVPICLKERINQWTRNQR